MVDTKHVEPIETGITAFDQLVQDIREIREIQDSRSLLHRRARSADSELPPEEKLPLFLSTPDEQETAFPQAAPQQSAREQSAPEPGTPRQTTFQQSTRQQSTWRRSAPQQDIPLQEARYQDRPYQDDRYRETPYQDAQYRDAEYQDTQYQDTWLHDTLEADRERTENAGAPSVLRRAVKAGLVTAAMVAAFGALFATEDGASLISNASASFAPVLPSFSAGIIRPAPAKPQVAKKIIATQPTPVATIAVAPPTREAIASAYQTALQSQPDARQAPAVQPAPAAPAPPPSPVPAVRRLDPDELAGLLKRAQGLLDTGDLSGARLLLTRAADAHEAKAA